MQNSSMHVKLATFLIIISVPNLPGEILHPWVAMTMNQFLLIM